MLDRVNKPAPEIIPDNTYLETKKPGFQKAGVLIRTGIVAIGLIALGAFIFSSKPAAQPVAENPQATEQVGPQTLPPAPSLAASAGGPAASAPVPEPKAATAPKPVAKPAVARRAAPAAAVTPPAAVTQPIPEVVAPATDAPPAAAAPPEPVSPPAASPAQ